MHAQRRSIDVPFSTLAKIVVTGVVLWAAYKTFSLLLLFGVSLLLAVTLYPIVGWAVHHRIKRGLALAFVALMVTAAFGLFAGVLLPAVGREIADVAQDLPQLGQKFETWAKSSPIGAQLQKRIKGHEQQSTLIKAIENPALLETVAGGALAVPVMLILALYLVADGPRLYAWLLAYVPRRLRPKVGKTADEVAHVVYAYVRGQLITSALVAVFSFVTLKLLHVPAPLALAVIAGVFDVVPFVGFIAFTVPAVLMALTVSPTAAAIVLVLYVAYHFIENYFIVPRVYGRELRLSTLTVLLALGVAGSLTGVVGAILVLPLIAAYPIVERLWLAPKLGEEPIADHVALDQALVDKDHETVKRVIDGDEHPREH